MKKISRALLLLLALLMVVTCFGACGEDTVDPADTSTSSGEETTSQTASEESKSESESEGDDTTEEGSVLDGVKFNNDVIRVFSWTPGNLSEYVESVTEETTLIDQAVFNRCDRAESRLNIRVSWTYVPKNNQFMDTAENENNNGGKYDVFASVSTHFPAACFPI